MVSAIRPFRFSVCTPTKEEHKLKPVLRGHLPAYFRDIQEASRKVLCNPICNRILNPMPNRPLGR